MAAGGQPSGAGPLEDRLRGLILGNAQTQAENQEGEPDISSSSNSQGGPVPPRQPRRRPNQAQRRQMSAQLSIPIDPRPQFQQPQGYSHHPQPRERYSHHGAPQPHSATLRPPSRGHPPFPPRPRHQPSLSYQGPMTTPSPFGWQQPPAQHVNPAMPYPMAPAPSDNPAPAHTGQAEAGLGSPGRRFPPNSDYLRAQAEMLEGLCNTIVADAEIEPAEIMEKENFRVMIEKVARFAVAEYERSQNGLHDFPPESVQLKCFGSLASGFATKSSDMDLGLLSPLSRLQPDAPDSPIPRLIEKAFLDIGLGARLLTQTRVPIIKVCEHPPEELRLALLAERAKWERGSTEQAEEEEVNEDGDARPLEDDHAESHFQEESLTREQKLQRLKQGSASSLSTYYGSAKRLLRKLGGRDITHSNIAEFKAEDIALLNEVSLAFVDGLTDSRLRERLLRYRSLNRYDLLSRPNLRTLLGVFTQIEGEQLALAWEARPFQEADQAREAAAETTIMTWRDLQSTSDYGRDPLFYQKELQVSVEKLRRIPSVEVLLFSQAHNESAVSYCARALRLFRELGGHDSRARADTILPTLIQHYIGGITNHSIRQQVADYQQSHGVTDLRAIGRRHKSLQLAHDYQVCLDKGVYEGETAVKVRQYVELLSAPISKPPAAGQTFGMIPLPSGSAPLLSEMRQLGDPSKTGPNQPRDRYHNALEFPKSGVGVQCDINFSAHLAVQNTLLLRCYSRCDPRVRPLVLFVKHWAKVRRINSPYRGTLGSYGYSLMMLHYLINVAHPFVLPNLQQLARPPPPNLTPQQVEETVTCKGCDVQFWRDEAEIMRLAHDDALTQNRESVGDLLRGFFEYYAKGGSAMSALPCRSFDWGRDVLSLRTHGGLLSKQAKGWTGAKTVVEVKPAAAPPPSSAAIPQPAPPPASAFDNTNTTTNSNIPTAGQHFPPQPGPSPLPNQQQQQQQQQPPHQSHHPSSSTASASASQPNSSSSKPVEVKEVRYRYLFAIEDPFELDHNVARTVTHQGIVSIRDEFRRAFRIIKAVRRGSGSGSGSGSALPGHGHGHGQQGQIQGQGYGQGQGVHQGHHQGHHQGQGRGGGGVGGGGWRQRMLEEDLLEDVGKAEEAREREQFARLLDELHGVDGGFVDGDGSGGGGGGDDGAE